MSLTSQLADGELADWCAAHLPGTADLAASVAVLGRQHRPVRPRSGQVERTHWANIGGAFGQRLAFLVEPAPPYFAMLGALAAGVASPGWAHQAALSWPTHADLPRDQRQRALELRPTPSGWLDLRGGPHEPAGDPHEAVLTDLLDRTTAYLATHAPAGTLGTPGVEAGLARVCWALDLYEGRYRGGTWPPALAQLCSGGRVPTVEQLRGLADEPVVAELVDLARRFHESGALIEFHRQAADPPRGRALGTAAPTFVEHWADGDLVVGHTLLDVKTVIRLDNPDRTARWLWQLLAYAWLDTADLYRIRCVGLYFARHGALQVWGLQTFADMLIGRTGRTDALRREFLQLASTVIHAEGGQPPPALPPPQRRHDGMRL